YLNISNFIKLTHLSVTSSKIEKLDLTSFSYYYFETKVNLVDLLLTFKKSELLFGVNVKLFREAQHFNTYFVNKIYFDKNGDIKNSIRLTKSFGNIENLHKVEDLSKIVAKKDFQEYWFVHKDLIDICKNCEYRYFCVDNRIPIKRNENEWFNTVECNYNPFIGAWPGERDFKTLSECGIISNKYCFKIT